MKFRTVRKLNDTNIYIYNEGHMLISTFVFDVDTLKYTVYINIKVKHYVPFAFDSYVDAYYGLRDILKLNGYDVSKV